MQLPFDQILGKNNPLKLPDVAAVEAGNRTVQGSLKGRRVTHETPIWAGWYEKPKGKQGSHSQIK